MNRKELIIVLTITFIVIVIWIIADAYHTKPAVPLDPKLQKILDPVEPNFDEEAIKAIKNPPVIQLPVITNPQPQPSEKPATKSAILR